METHIPAAPVNIDIGVNMEITIAIQIASVSYMSPDWKPNRKDEIKRIPLNRVLRLDDVNHRSKTDNHNAHVHRAASCFGRF